MTALLFLPSGQNLILYLVGARLRWGHAIDAHHEVAAVLHSPSELSVPGFDRESGIENRGGVLKPRNGGSLRVVAGSIHGLDLAGTETELPRRILQCRTAS